MTNLVERERQAIRYEGMIRVVAGKQAVDDAKDLADAKKVASRRHVWTPDARIKSKYTGLYAPCKFCHRAELATSPRQPGDAVYTYFAGNHTVERSP